jgi:hypothetical protein
MLLAAALLALSSAAVQAQTTAYKCPSRGSATYSDVACTDGRRVGAPAPRQTDKTRPVPQDRAKIARRSVLSEEERAECRVLDARILEQQAALKARPAPVTLEDEMPLVFSKKRLRELGC